MNRFFFKIAIFLILFTTAEVSHGQTESPPPAENPAVIPEPVPPQTPDPVPVQTLDQTQTQTQTPAPEATSQAVPATPPVVEAPPAPEVAPTAVPAPVAAFPAATPAIAVHEFEVKPTRISKSGRVYQFTADANQLPKDASLILVQKDEKPVMAFRVLKTTANPPFIFAKKVKVYDSAKLTLEETYSAIEKTDEKNIEKPLENTGGNTAPSPVNENSAPLTAPEGAPPTAPTAPGAEAAEAAAGTMDATPPGTIAPPEGYAVPPPDDVISGFHPPAAPTGEAAGPNARPSTLGQHSVSSMGGGQNLNVEDYDQDLDQTTSPARPGNPNKGFISEGEDADEEEEVAPGKTEYEVEERQGLNPFNNMITVSVGYYRNISNFVLPGSVNNGLGLSYSRTFAHDIFLDPRSMEDSLAVELGFERYTQVNLAGTNDVNTINPLFVNLRYDLYFSKNFALNFYAGFQYNWLYSTENTTTDVQAAISGPQPTVGIGLLYAVGPQWFIRATIGFDQIALGLCVKW